MAPCEAVPTSARTFDRAFVMQERLLAPEKVKITGRSSLVLAGDVTIESLELDGALEVVAEPGTQAHIKRLVVRNDGWTLVRVQAPRILCKLTARPH